MRFFQISTDLWMELGDDGVVRVVSRSMQNDRDPDCAGVVVIYQNEIDAVIAALLEAVSELGNDRNHNNQPGRRHSVFGPGGPGRTG
jgi:hypothetical protein